MIVFAAITPHSPISIPGIGSRDDYNAVRKTVDAFNELSKELESCKPDTIIVISPHAHIETYAFSVNSGDKLIGNFSQFGLEKIAFEYENDIGIIDRLAFVAELQDLPVQMHETFLDHGAMIPLYHLTRNIKPKVVHLSFSMLDFAKHYSYGELLGKVCDESSHRIAIIASGDLSHRLTPNAPAGYSPNAMFFDQRIIGILRHRDANALMSLQQETIEEAAECGLRSFIIMMGALTEKNTRFDLLAYEYPFGIGYLTARFL